MLSRVKIPALTTACFTLCISLGQADTELPTFGGDPALWGEEEKVYAATKFITQLKKAPAVATVYTAQQIENMGARTILDVLKHVPGIGISVDSSPGQMAIEARGAKVNYSTNVLMLIDGHKVNDVYYNTGAFGYFEYPVRLIKRLEVIRSPGSSLYGTGAFGAVINIITKENVGIDNAEVGIDYGTYNFTQSTALINRAINDLKIQGFFNYSRSDSRDLYIEQDAGDQSGYTLDDFDRYDVSVKMDYHNFNATLSYLKKDAGPYIGVAHVLNDETKQRARHAYIDLQYLKWINEDLQLNFRGYYDRHLYLTDWEIFTPKTNPAFPDSMYGKPHADMRITGAEAQLDYTLSENNFFTIGANYEVREIANTSHVTNFVPQTFAPLGSMQDVTAWGNFTKEATQYISAIYAQNIWHITPRLSSTLGARYDNYNNFGDTLNPRLAIVWNQSERTTIKALYGTAFRAPNFVELYIINNPVALGDENLKPEKNETYEISFNHDFSPEFSTELNIFQTKITDLIIQDPTGVGNQTKYTNKGGLEIEGFEIEVKAKKDNDNYAYANYTFQNPRDADTDNLHFGITRHRANAGFNTSINNRINFNANMNASGRRSRKTDDALGRKPLGKYVIVDASMIFKDLLSNDTKFQITAHNLLDRTYFTPDEEATVASDYPMPGRTITASIKISN